MKNAILIMAMFALAGCRKEQVTQPEAVREINTVVATQPETVEQEVLFDYEFEVAQNLVRGENDKYLIRVDRLTNGDHRYLSWNKPKIETDMPDMVLKGPEIERQGTGGGYVYTFKTADGHRYVVEDVQMGETEDAMGRFLKVMKGDRVLFRSKMSDL